MVHSVGGREVEGKRVVLKSLQKHAWLLILKVMQHENILLEPGLAFYAQAAGSREKGVSLLLQKRQLMFSPGCCRKSSAYVSDFCGERGS